MNRNSGPAIGTIAVIWVMMIASGNAFLISMGIAVAMIAVLALASYVSFQRRSLPPQYRRAIEHPRSRAERAYIANLHANRFPASECPCPSCQEWSRKQQDAVETPLMTLTPNGQPEIIQLTGRRGPKHAEDHTVAAYLRKQHGVTYVSSIRPAQRIVHTGPDGQPETRYVSPPPEQPLDPGKAKLFRMLTATPPAPPCSEGGPCKAGHRRVVRDNHGNRVATLCLGCGKHTYDQAYLDHGGKF